MNQYCQIEHVFSDSDTGTPCYFAQFRPIEDWYFLALKAFLAFPILGISGVILLHEVGVFLMPLELQPKNLPAEELQKLSSELSELSRQHAKAYEDDIFLGLTKERTAELREIIGKPRLK
jgi:hypothetical protein